MGISFMSVSFHRPGRSFRGIEPVVSLIFPTVDTISRQGYRDVSNLKKLCNREMYGTGRKKRGEAIPPTMKKAHMSGEPFRKRY